jgi:diacylglycerol kinase (ATP)
MANRNQGGIRRIILAAGYSMGGLRQAWQHEAAFRQEALGAIVLIPLGLWLGHSPVDRVLLVGSVILVVIVELLNSAVEATVDRVGMDTHELSGRAKDMGSAAVLLALLICGFTWAAILWDRIILR